LGEELFLQRLAQPFEFETKNVAGRLQKLIALLQLANVGNWVGRTIVALQGFYPMYLTVRRNA
jgi:hypothetical protein